jgi:nitrogen fixation protein NifU and related proteins
MMNELRDLYQEVILDHTKRPRNFHELADANHHADGYNALCGDKLTVYLKVEDDVVKDVSFLGAGCAISTASASMMTESLKGKTRQQVEELFESFHTLVTREKCPVPELQKLGKLTVFSGVREFPVRVKCATLAWHTMRAALDDRQESVSTED